MATKREERKQRSEAQREAEDRERRQRQWRSRALFVAGLLALIAMGALAISRRSDGEENNGKVWSAAHGHWHDK